MKKISPSVSIIIIAYNEQRHICHALKSAQKQSMQDIEIIVIDDGSTDNTAHIVKQVANKDSRINLYSLNTNHGRYYARMYGVKKATGKYITFLDADDYYDFDAISLLFNLIETTNADVVEMGYKYKLGYIKLNAYPSNKLPIKTSFADLLMNGNISHSTCNKMYLHDIISKSKFPSIYCNYGEDFIFNISIMEHVKIYATLYEYKYNYRYKSASLDSLKRFEDIKILHNQISTLPQIKGNKEYTKLMAKKIYDSLTENVSLQIYNPFNRINKIKKWIISETDNTFWHKIRHTLNIPNDDHFIHEIIRCGKERARNNRLNYAIRHLFAVFNL